MGAGPRGKTLGATIDGRQIPMKQTFNQIIPFFGEAKIKNMRGG
jgi:hypothetical protein